MITARDSQQDLSQAFDQFAGILPSLGVSQEDIPALKQSLLENPALLDGYLQTLLGSGALPGSGGGGGGGRASGLSEKEAQSRDNTIAFLSNGLDRIDDLLDPKKQDGLYSILGNPVPGFTALNNGSLGSGIAALGFALPGTSASDARAAFQGIRDIARSAGFIQAKGTGAISNAESEFLGNAITTLDFNASYEFNVKEIKRLRDFMAQLLDAVKRRQQGENVPSLVGSNAGLVTGPAPTGPAPTGPAPTGPAPTGPAPTGPAPAPAPAPAVPQQAGQSGALPASTSPLAPVASPVPPARPEGISPAGAASTGASPLAPATSLTPPPRPPRPEGPTPADAPGSPQSIRNYLLAVNELASTTPTPEGTVPAAPSLFRGVPVEQVPPNTVRAMAAAAAEQVLLATPPAGIEPGNDEFSLAVSRDQTPQPPSSSGGVVFDIPSSGTISGKIIRAFRSASFNTTDQLQARVAYDRARRDPAMQGVTFDETLDAVRRAYEEDPSLLADFAGAFVPGVAAGKATVLTGKLLGLAATRAGVMDAALAWAKRHPFLKALFASSAGGAAGVGIYEGSRETMNQVFQDEFSPSAVVHSVIVGSLVGAVGGPAVTGLFSGGAKIARWVGQWLPSGSGRAQWGIVTSKVYSALRNPGESMQQTGARLENDINAFQKTHGYYPALTDIISADQVEALTSVVTGQVGLRAYATQLSKDGIGRAITSFENLVKSPKQPKSFDQLKTQAGRIFNSLMRQEGDTFVAVSPEVITTLAQPENLGLLTRLAGGSNVASREIVRVVNAHQKIGEIVAQANNAVEHVALAGKREEVALISQKIGEIIASEIASGGLESSELATLKALYIRMSKALGVATARAGTRRAQLDANNMNALLKTTGEIITNFQKNGLQIPLRHANDLRTTASTMAFNMRGTIDGIAPRAINEAIASVGTREVPRYGKAVRLWSSTMTRVEAQETGGKVLAGKVRSADLAANLEASIPVSGAPVSRNVAAIRAGTAEGTRLSILDKTREGPGAAAGLVAGLKDNRNIQEGLGSVFSPAVAEKISSGARQLDKSVRGNLALAGVQATKEGAKNAADLSRVVESLFIGSISGTAKASLAAFLVNRLSMRPATAKKLIAAAGDPAQTAKVVGYLRRKGISLSELSARLAILESAREADFQRAKDRSLGRTP